jgi:hypothetical protein
MRWPISVFGPVLLHLLMRLRIVTTPPLPKVKAWFNVDLPDEATGVSVLKDHLCEYVLALKNAGFRGSDVLLLLDDFEFLNESSLSVLRDGDLIQIKLNVVDDKWEVDESV